MDGTVGRQKVHTFRTDRQNDFESFNLSLAVAAIIVSQQSITWAQIAKSYRIHRLNVIEDCQHIYNLIRQLAFVSPKVKTFPNGRERSPKGTGNEEASPRSAPDHALDQCCCHVHHDRQRLENL
jgi:hypothetical protein